MKWHFVPAILVLAVFSMFVSAVIGTAIGIGVVAYRLVLVWGGV
jgi:hypothetical protein